MLRKASIALVVVFLTSVIALATPFGGGNCGGGGGDWDPYQHRNRNGNGYCGGGGGEGGHHGGGGHCVPEPATMTLLGVGIAGAAGVRAWRKRKAN